MSRLKITASNVLACEETLEFLLAELAHLAEMTARYPVIVEFCGVRLVFRSREDILEAIATLKQQVATYRAAA